MQLEDRNACPWTRLPDYPTSSRPCEARRRHRAGVKNIQVINKDVCPLGLSLHQCTPVFEELLQNAKYHKTFVESARNQTSSQPTEGVRKWKQLHGRSDAPIGEIGMTLGARRLHRRNRTAHDKFVGNARSSIDQTVPSTYYLVKQHSQRREQSMRRPVSSGGRRREPMYSSQLKPARPKTASISRSEPGIKSLEQEEVKSLPQRRKALGALKAAGKAVRHKKLSPFEIRTYLQSQPDPGAFGDWLLSCVSQGFFRTESDASGSLDVSELQHAISLFEEESQDLPQAQDLTPPAGSEAPVQSQESRNEVLPDSTSVPLRQAESQEGAVESDWFSAASAHSWEESVVKVRSKLGAVLDAHQLLRVATVLRELDKAHLMDDAPRNQAEMIRQQVIQDGSAELRGQLTDGGINFREYKQQLDEIQLEAQQHATQVENDKRDQIEFKRKESLRILQEQDQGEILRQQAAARIKLRLVIRNLAGKEDVVHVTGAHTVSELKEELQKQVGLSTEHQLIHKGWEVTNNKLTLFDCKFSDGDTLLTTCKSTNPCPGVYLCIADVQEFASSALDQLTSESPEGTVLAIQEWSESAHGSFIGRTDRNSWVELQSLNNGEPSLQPVQEHMMRLDVRDWRGELKRRWECSPHAVDMALQTSLWEATIAWQAASGHQSVVVVEVKNLVGKTARVVLSSGHTLLDLRKQVEAQLGVPPAKQRLMKGEKELRDDTLSLTELHVRDRDVLVVTGVNC